VRIRSVVGELGSERVDIIPWADDPAQLVANALSPAQVLNVNIDKESRTATAHVPENQLSLAIGKDGQNARLAAKLTGWRIDIKPTVEGSPHPDPPPQAGEEDSGTTPQVGEGDSGTTPQAGEGDPKAAATEDGSGAS
jgi:N utilization substance protein A